MSVAEYDTDLVLRAEKQTHRPRAASARSDLLMGNSEAQGLEDWFPV